MVRTEHVLDSWRTIRQDTAAAVEDFPAGEMDFRATPEVATFGEIARHILEASEGLTGLLLAGDENFATPDFRKKMARHIGSLPANAPAADLAAALRQSLDKRLAELAAQPPEYELTHRAQLFLYLRLKGIVPATTRRRLAQQGAK